MKREKKYDCIIIGAGLSGLAAGIRLAHFGKSVCIVESHSRVGGLNSYYRRKGMRIDSGLHAMTNFVLRGSHKSSPLLRLLRQLRVDYDELALREQKRSLISFPGTGLVFSNDFEELISSIRENFPEELDGFLKLDSMLSGFNSFDLDAGFSSAREQIRAFIRDPLLEDMLLCPLMYYGSAVENDMDFAQFSIMYRSIFREGFCRPAGGIKTLIDVLLSRYNEAGGEIRTSAGVRQIESKDGLATGLILEDSSRLETVSVLSSAGRVETLDLCGIGAEAAAEHHGIRKGQLAFTEILYLLERPPSESGYDYTIQFYCKKKKFKYERPRSWTDPSSGVICAPSNFRYKDGDETVLPLIRVTNQADYSRWRKAGAEEYSSMKQRILDESAGTVLERCGVSIPETAFSDCFTPRTVEKYTGHLNGAVYGSPDKIKDGTTHLDNLFLCGTDQGFMGITGAMLSGISMANLHILKGN